jgi:F0F1-type ATP synthase membrane subunit b/b'
MKRLFPTVTFVTLLFVSPLIQADGDRAAQIEQRMEEAKARLNLSEEQLDQMAPVLEKSMEKRQAIFSNYGIDLESGNGSGRRLGFRQARAMKQELEAVRAETLNELDGILNDEQLDEFKRMQEERKGEMRERIRGGASQGSRWQPMTAKDRVFSRN